MKMINLNGVWQMRQLSDPDWIQAQVPGSVYADLLAAGVIDDPFYRDNELSVTGLSDNDYEYTREFLVSADLLRSDCVILCCDGLDTVSEVSLNGQVVACTDNMHRSYEFHIKDFLVAGSNRIHIIFRSPVEYITRKNAEDSLWNPNTAIAGMAHLRKAHYMFGWDWGPTLPDMGIWRNISIRCFDFARLTDVHIIQHHADDSVELEINIKLEQWRHAKLETAVTIKDPNGKEVVQSASIADSAVQLRMRIENPQRWWPNGYGDQPLYRVTAELSADGTAVDDYVANIGLRTLTVIQDKDEWGKGFAFEVNGVAIFSMGADYVPEDSILSHRSRERTERLIHDCVAANFNTIRIWGGGTYPECYFYDLCDQYGLIVWQDFMFACAVYRMSDEFTGNIQREVADNVKRLRHHPSLGLWCGNNEMEWGWVEWGVSSDPQLKADYLRQFEEVIPAVLEETDPNTFYWPASPSSGGGFNKPNDENVGDVHDWMVWHGRQPFTYFRSHYYRFLSEFGLQSFPSLETVQSFSLPEDRNIFSRVMEHHQKDGSGNEKILYYIAQTFKYPQTLDALIYASQLVQAEGMRYAIEHMRRHRGRCMGSIYWQLNDCWPVASWSSIDSLGNWKALHYLAKRFYQPVLLSACEHGSGATLHVTNDTRDAISGLVTWKLRDSSSSTLLEGNISVTLAPLSAEQVAILEFKELAKDTGMQRSVYLEYALTVEEETLCCDSVLFVKPKYYEFHDPHIVHQVQETTDAYLITLASKAFAKFVELTVSGMSVTFSDNYIHLSAGEPRSIRLNKSLVPEIYSTETLSALISVRSVYDIEEHAEGS